jgi:hypothetical protein
VSKDFDEAELAMITKVINRQTKGYMDINIRIVDHLLLSPRGKYQPIISNIGKEKNSSDNNIKFNQPC